MRRIDSITSATNSKFQTWKTLLTPKGIKKERLFILSGEKLIFEFLKKPNLKISCELITKGLSPLQNEGSIFDLDPILFKELDVVGTHHNLLILEAPEIPESLSRDPISGLEVVAPLGDPKNLGALIRTCVAFGVRKIHLTSESSNPFHPQCLKASAGTVLKAPLYKAGPLKDWDQSNSWALDSSGQSIETVSKPTAARIIVGEEGPGIQGFERVQRISIPTQNVESLNATVAASLLIYAWK